MIRKLIALLLALVMCGATACAQATSDAAATGSPEEAYEFAPTGSNVLVACFSCTGNTWRLAEYAAECLNADLFAIEPEEPYTEDDLAYWNDDCRANREMADDTCRPALAALVDNIAQYDTVIIASPTWWGRAPRIIETFIESHDLSGKTVLHFSTSGGSGYGDTGEILAALTDDTVLWLEGARLLRDTTEEQMAQWLSEKGIAPYEPEPAAQQP